MPVVTDFPFTFDPINVLRRHGREASALIERPALRQIYDLAVTEARTLVRPAIAYAVHPILRAEEERLIIAGGQALESPVVARLFGEASEVVLTVYTIGPRLEERAAEYQAARNYVLGFALDLVGSAAVDEVGQVAYRLIEDLAKARGLKASIPLNPGTSHWPLSGNKVLAALVPAGDIGVEMLDSGLMHPFKSISFAVALGERVLTPADGSSCDYCDTRALCRR
jgi:hypothetical protein